MVTLQNVTSSALPSNSVLGMGMFQLAQIQRHVMYQSHVLPINSNDFLFYFPVVRLVYKLIRKVFKKHFIYVCLY
jgi:hypothetical protein